MQITVLGTGLVGYTIVKDLAKEKNFQIIAVDINQDVLSKLHSQSNIKTIQRNLQEPDTIAPIISDSELVINAVPGFMGFQTLKKIIECGKDVIDISFFSENPFSLDTLAKSKNVTAVVDCGVAPGLCNILVGHMNGHMEQITEYRCYVGGLPRNRIWPYEYKALFSPSDVIEEYTRPVKQVENGQTILLPPLSEIEMVEFKGIGTLEAFNTDGLRSLITTMQIPNMKEKTLRYPGHAHLMRIFRESGFFSQDTVEVDNQKIKPRDLTSKLLFKQWQLEENEEDITVMRVIIKGEKNSNIISHTFELIDYFDIKNKTSSMARATGFTCTIIARQLLNGLFKQKGICPPEYIGAIQECYTNLLKEYEKYHIALNETIKNRCKETTSSENF